MREEAYKPRGVVVEWFISFLSCEPREAIVQVACTMNGLSR